jgi:hypothetical protein
MGWAGGAPRRSRAASAPAAPAVPATGKARAASTARSLRSALGWLFAAGAAAPGAGAGVNPRAAAPRAGSLEQEELLLHPHKRRLLELSIETILSEPRVSGAFRDFMLAAFSEELVSLWLDLYWYDRIPSESPGKRERAQELWQQHFACAALPSSSFSSSTSSTSSFSSSSATTAATIATAAVPSSWRSEDEAAAPQRVLGDAGTLEALRVALQVDAAGCVQQREASALARAFEVVYVRLVTVLKVGYVPAFLASPSFEQLVALHVEGPEASCRDGGVAESALRLLLDPYASACLLDFVHSNQIAAECDRVVARMAAAAASPSGDGTTSGTVTSSTAAIPAASAATSTTPRPRSWDKFTRTKRRALADKRQQALSQRAVNHAVTTISCLRSAAALVNLFQEIDDFRGATADPRHQFQRLQRILTHYGAAEAPGAGDNGGAGAGAVSCSPRLLVRRRTASGSSSSSGGGSYGSSSCRDSGTDGGGGNSANGRSAPIQPPITSLQQHLSKFKAKPARYRDMVFVQHDSGFLDGMRDEVLRRLDAYVLPAFVASPQYTRLARLRGDPVADGGAGTGAGAGAGVGVGAGSGTPHQQEQEPSVMSDKLDVSLQRRERERIAALRRFAEERLVASAPMLSNSLESALALPWGAFYLRKMALRLLQEESVLFLLEVNELRAAERDFDVDDGEAPPAAAAADADAAAANSSNNDNHADSAHQARLRLLRKRAVRICDTFLADGAPMPLNISHEQRETVLSAVHDQHAHSARAFDVVYREVIFLLNNNLWPAFTQDRTYEDFLNKCALSQHGRVGLSRLQTARSAQSPFPPLAPERVSETQELARPASHQAMNRPLSALLPRHAVSFRTPLRILTAEERLAVDRHPLVPVWVPERR